MKIRVRGWGRNFGWRELFAARLRESVHSTDDADVPATGVSIETRPQRAGNASNVNLFFKVSISRPLNGDYIFEIGLSKTDIARLYKISMADASHSEQLRLFEMAGVNAEASEDE